MRFFWTKVQLLLVVVCLSLAEAKMRGEQDETRSQKERALIGNNVFNADSLRHTLSTQRQPYKNPYRNEKMTMSMLNLSARTINRQREWRAMAVGTARDGHVEVIEVAADEQILVIGKGSSHSSSSSSSSRRSSSSSSSRSSKSKSSKSKGKGKGKGGSSSSSSRSSKSSRSKPVHPPPPTTLSPTQTPTLVPTTTPTGVPTPLVTGTPTCNPTGNFFPPSVTGFFMAPSGEGSELQNQLDSTLQDIQVPGEFQQQCVEEARF